MRFSLLRMLLPNSRKTSTSNYPHLFGCSFGSCITRSMSINHILTLAATNFLLIWCFCNARGSAQEMRRVLTASFLESVSSTESLISSLLPFTGTFLSGTSCGSSIIARQNVFLEVLRPQAAPITPSSEAFATLLSLGQPQYAGMADELPKADVLGGTQWVMNHERGMTHSSFHTSQVLWLSTP
jgi:hypothetical protein